MTKRAAEQSTEDTKKRRTSSTAADESNIDADLINQSEFADAEENPIAGEDEDAAAAASAAVAAASKEEEAAATAAAATTPATTTDTQPESAPAKQQILHSTQEKPLAGTEEWHRIRKDNHKEVERRRRETINSGIKELGALLPSSETNKSQIIQRAIEYIKRLKENEKNNVEKWTLEKLLNDQAITELTATNEKLKSELERAYREVEHWKKVCNIAKSDK